MKVKGEKIKVQGSVCTTDQDWVIVEKAIKKAGTYKSIFLREAVMAAAHEIVGKAGK